MSWTVVFQPDVFERIVHCLGGKWAASRLLRPVCRDFASVLPRFCETLSMTVEWVDKSPYPRYSFLDMVYVPGDGGHYVPPELPPLMVTIQLQRAGNLCVFNWKDVPGKGYASVLIPQRFRPKKSREVYSVRHNGKIHITSDGLFAATGFFSNSKGAYMAKADDFSRDDNWNWYTTPDK